jgi:hypothetical protein
VFLFRKARMRLGSVLSWYMAEDLLG